MLKSGADIGQLVADIVGTGALARLQVRGASMYPSVRAEDVLLIESCDPDSLCTGSVILTLNETLTAHRIRSIRRHAGTTTITTRGDNRREDDHEVSAAHVVGRVIAVERLGRRYHIPRLSIPLSLITRFRLLGARGRVRLAAWLRRSGAGELSLQA